MIRHSRKPRSRCAGNMRGAGARRHREHHAPGAPGDATSYVPPRRRRGCFTNGESRLRDTISVKDLGDAHARTGRLRCITAETAAIQAAITRPDAATRERASGRPADGVGATSGSQTCVGFPNGTYYITHAGPCGLHVPHRPWRSGVPQRHRSYERHAEPHRLPERGTRLPLHRRQATPFWRMHLDTSTNFLERLTHSGGDMTSLRFIQHGSDHTIIRDPRVVSRRSTSTSRADKVRSRAAGSTATHSATTRTTRRSRGTRRRS